MSGAVVSLSMAQRARKAPFPWFGGKSQIAADVWARLGRPAQYIEPFCGSAAVLLEAGIDRELGELTKQLGHGPTSTEVLKAATAKRHPLHAYFEWDDAKIAFKWRIEQAKRMLMSRRFTIRRTEGNPHVYQRADASD